MGRTEQRVYIGHEVEIFSSKSSWYWVRCDEVGVRLGSPVGPFATGLQAEVDWREAMASWIVKEKP